LAVKVAIVEKGIEFSARVQKSFKIAGCTKTRLKVIYGSSGR
jgi:hypothetical protein